MIKPPYRIPLMAEIEEIPKNGLLVASTFSGCGGSSLGYKMAGCKVVYANEFVPAAYETYQANFPGTFVDTRDIRTITGHDVLEKCGLKPGQLDILDGSPPCAAFSVCGVKDEAWGKEKVYSDTTQRVDDLFFEYIRLLKVIQPKVFVAENVSGLIKGTAKGYFKEILVKMKESGYRVRCALLNAGGLGVPQKRERAIFIGVREDLKIDPVHPEPLPYHYTLKEAFEGVSKDGLEYWLPKGSKGEILWRNSEPGTELRIAAKKLYKKDGWFNYKKLSPNRQSLTMVQGSQGLLHWDEPRTLSIAEAKRVCSFHDDFKLSGSFSQQWERLGRAVPPMMMCHIAKTIEEKILCKTAR